jgi:hypothetical protein
MEEFAELPVCLRRSWFIAFSLLPEVRSQISFRSGWIVMRVEKPLGRAVLWRQVVRHLLTSFF